VKTPAHAILLTCLAACSSTGVGNPVKEQTISLAIVQEIEIEPETAGAGGGEDAAGAGGMQGDGGTSGANGLPRAWITKAVLVFAELRLLACDSAPGASVVLQGPFVADLVAGNTTPSLPSIEAPGGVFCGIEAPLGVSAIEELEGNSVVFEGSRPDGTLFSVRTHVATTLRAVAPADAAWLPAQVRTLFWALKPQSWLSRDELEMQPSRPFEGRRRIDITPLSDPALYLRFRQRLAGTSRVYGDVDDDGLFTAADRIRTIGNGSTDAD
jgi:hypothetical protein